MLDDEVKVREANPLYSTWTWTTLSLLHLISLVSRLLGLGCTNSLSSLVVLVLPLVTTLNLLPIGPNLAPLPLPLPQLQLQLQLSNER